MVTRGRWNRAQQYEQSFWEDLANRIADGSAADFGWYNWRAEQLKKLLREAGAERLSAGNARLLEIGSGPIGIVTFFPAQERVAVDPLENYYGSHPVLSE